MLSGPKKKVRRIVFHFFNKIQDGLHTNLVTVLYFFIINVLCGAGGDASFAPQANLVIS